MNFNLKSLIAGSALVGTLVIGAGTQVSAAEVDVNQGDSLWSIAQDNNTSVTNLKNLNNLSSDLIHPNQTLQIDKSNEDAKQTSHSTYTIKSGDTLNKISKEHGVSVNNLKSWNNLDSDLIITGDTLNLKASDSNSNAKSKSQSNSDVKQESKDQPKQESESKKKKESSKSKSNQESKEKEQPKQESKASNQKESATQSQSNDSTESMTMEATAYTANCDTGCTGVTATGIDLNSNPNKKVVAVDPSVIPLGSKVHVEGYGEAIAGDTGGAINGNRIDIHVPTKGDATNFGRQSVKVTILD